MLFSWWNVIFLNIQSTNPFLVAGLSAARCQGLELCGLSVQEAIQDGEFSACDVMLLAFYDYRMIYSSLQIQQYKAIKYDISPLSPISRHRLNMVRKKVGGRLTEEGRGWDVCLGAGVRPWWNIDPLPSRWSREAHSETGHTTWFHIKGQWSPCIFCE